jgi:hypothetical protein
VTVVLEVIFVVLVLLGFVAGVLFIVSVFRSFEPYYRWRRLLADQGAVRFDWQSGLPHRMGDEMDAWWRLLSRYPDDDPTMEAARIEVRGGMLRALGWVGVSLVICAVGVLVALAAGFD